MQQNCRGPTSTWFVFATFALCNFLRASLSIHIIYLLSVYSLRPPSGYRQRANAANSSLQVVSPSARRLRASCRASSIASAPAAATTDEHLLATGTYNGKHVDVDVPQLWAKT
jgi:hypothetical protein